MTQSQLDDVTWEQPSAGQWATWEQFWGFSGQVQLYVTHVSVPSTSGISSGISGWGQDGGIAVPGRYSTKHSANVKIKVFFATGGKNLNSLLKTNDINKTPMNFESCTVLRRSHLILL